MNFQDKANILYNNCKNLKPYELDASIEIKNVDGGLVGGASLTAKSFLPIIHAQNTNGD